MKENLEEIASRMQAIIDTAIDGIITIDSQDVIGQNVSILMPQPYRSQHDGYIHSYLSTKKPKIIGIGREVIGQRKSGQTFPFRLAVSEVILNDRIIFTGIVHDLTEIKKVEQALRESNENLENKVEERTNELEAVVNKLLFTNKQLEFSRKKLEESLQKEKELNELKSRFVSMASHEFRTPLSTVMSSASIISKYKNEDQDDKRLKHVDRIKSAVNNLTGILNDFLSLSKLEENKVEVKKNDIEFEALCASIEADLANMFKEGQRIAHENINVVRVFKTDERILKNILFNLISNAIKYSPVNSTIQCRAEIVDKQLKLSIKDQGIGIPENEQKYLFERFFRASNVENVQGTGLGLNIVKRYVELLNGGITFESKQGFGTTFHITIEID